MDLILSNIHWVFYLFGLMLFPRMTAVVFIWCQVGIHIGFKILFTIIMVTCAIMEKVVWYSDRLNCYDEGRTDLIIEIRKQIKEKSDEGKDNGFYKRD